MNCLQYWDLAENIGLEAVIALWCNVEPSQLSALNHSTSCMDAKRQLLIEALKAGRLEYDKSRPVPSFQGGVWRGANLDEMIDKDCVFIKKDSLKRWFECLPIKDRPEFLFDESRAELLPPDGSSEAEFNTMKALAIMVWLLTEKTPAYKIKGRPNAEAINEALQPLIEICFPNNPPKIKSFNKKISAALKLFDLDEFDFR